VFHFLDKVRTFFLGSGRLFAPESASLVLVDIFTYIDWSGTASTRSKYLEGLAPGGYSWYSDEGARAFISESLAHLEGAWREICASYAALRARYKLPIGESKKATPP
jgi:hypothetical protein